MDVTVGEFASVIYRSLAVSYKKILEDLEKRRNLSIGQINVIGGGSQADYLNRLTRDLTGREVCAGPVEATAIGNLISQMIAAREIDNLDEGRILV